MNNLSQGAQHLLSLFYQVSNNALILESDLTVFLIIHFLFFQNKTDFTT